jgi:hypothetical protein
MNEDQELIPAEAFDAEEGVVIHNPEQVEIMQTLANLREHCDEAIAEVHTDFDQNESLYGQSVYWPEFGCVRAERWIDGDGNLGWRCYCEGVVGAGSAKLREAVRVKIANRGWDNVEVVPTC